MQWDVVSTDRMAADVAFDKMNAHATAQQYGRHPTYWHRAALLRLSKSILVRALVSFCEGLKLKVGSATKKPICPALLVQQATRGK